MYNTVFPRIPGDTGNAKSHPHIPVSCKTVKNAYAFRIMGKEQDTKLIMPFIEASQELEVDGVKSITISCGFLAVFQTLLADSVRIFSFP